MKALPESRIPVLEICDIDTGKPIVVKVNPGDNPYDRFINTSYNLEDVIKIFVDLLTEDDIIKLKYNKAEKYMYDQFMNKLKEIINNEHNTNR